MDDTCTIQSRSTGLLKSHWHGVEKFTHTQTQYTCTVWKDPSKKLTCTTAAAPSRLLSIPNRHWQAASRHQPWHCETGCGQ